MYTRGGSFEHRHDARETVAWPWLRRHVPQRLHALAQAALARPAARALALGAVGNRYNRVVRTMAKVEGAPVTCRPRACNNRHDPQQLYIYLYLYIYIDIDTYR